MDKMHDDKIDRLYKLLVIHEKLLGHPKLGNVKAEVETELATLSEPPKNEGVDAPPPSLFPKGSGVVEKDTDRRV